MMNKIGLILIAAFTSINAYAWRESNGGIGVVAEAHLITHHLVSEMFEVPALNKNYDLSKPYSITSRENLTLNGQIVDAYTENDWNNEAVLIYVNSTSWSTLSDLQKRALLLHELTHFMNRIDYDYAYSVKVLGMLERSEEIRTRRLISDYPLEDEIIESIDKCSLRSFNGVYDLIGSLKYTFIEKEQTLEQYIEASSCQRIKEQVKKLK